MRMIHVMANPEQAFTPLGEPRIIIAVPGAGSLGGICTNGHSVFVADADKHVIHVMQAMVRTGVYDHTLLIPLETTGLEIFSSHPHL